MDPQITAALVASDGKTSLALLHTDGIREVAYRHFDLQEIRRHGFDALSTQVGDALLRMLAEAQPAEFNQYLLLVPPPALRLRSIIVTLIDRSIRKQTTDYAATIDTLLTRHAADFANSPIPGIWAAVHNGLIVSRNLNIKWSPP
jgi:hypothetical protein